MMNINAGQIITDAMKRQKNKDLLMIVCHEFLSSWNRSTKRLNDAWDLDAQGVSVPTTLYGKAGE